MRIFVVKVKLLIYCFLAVILLISLLITGHSWILTKNHPLRASILVIEGWLPAGNLEMILDQINLEEYEEIFVTGVAHDHPEFLKSNGRRLKRMPAKLFSNGCLGISRMSMGKIGSIDTISEIKVFAWGSEAFGRFPNFFIAVGDSVIGNAFVTKTSSNYVFHYNVTLSDCHGIYFYFNNDMNQGGADRNLIIDSISINGVVFNKSEDFYIIHDHSLNSNSYTNYPFRSNAVLTTSYLKALGVRKDIITLDTFFNGRNKTMAAAKKLKAFINTNIKEENAINVLSVDGHSRRSYLAYKTVFSDKNRIGIISLKDIETENMQRKERLNRLIGEYAKLLVTIILYLFS